jgi:hypothetical protein
LRITLIIVISRMSLMTPINFRILIICTTLITLLCLIILMMRIISFTLIVLITLIAPLTVVFCLSQGLLESIPELHLLVQVNHPANCNIADLIYALAQLNNPNKYASNLQSAGPRLRVIRAVAHPSSQGYSCCCAPLVSGLFVLLRAL